MNADRRIARFAGDTERQLVWINLAMESLWLVLIVLAPLVFLARSYGEWSSVIGSYELPKIAVLRTGAGLIAMLWLLEWALRSGGAKPSFPRWMARPLTWHQGLAEWLGAQPVRWLTAAVIFFFASLLLSTALSTSPVVSLWGDVPGQDSYSAYTTVSFGLVFAAIATHIKTENQLWRLVGAIVVMGFLSGLYAVFQHYGWDFLDLMEPLGHNRSTATFGGTIFAGAVLLMTIPVTVMAATRYLLGNVAATGFAVKATVGVVALSVQLLGLVFIASRGPWIGTLATLITFLVLLVVFVGWRTVGRAGLVLGIGQAVTVAVLVSPLQSIADDAAEEQSASRSLDPSDTSELIFSVGGEISSGGFAGRKEIWDTTWEMVVDRPWFDFEQLSLSSLRPIIGYGPDQFRSTYLLVSPARTAASLLPQEVGHAHNFFLHQAVETGFVGLLASVGIFIAAFGLGVYFWLRQRAGLTVVHGLVLAGLLAILAGRFLEQMVGVSRVSDLLIFWVLLAIFVALPAIFLGVNKAEPANQQAVGGRQSRSPGMDGSQVMAWAPLRWALAVGLIAALAFVTWTKNVDYVRSALILDEAAYQFDQGSFDHAMSSISDSIGISPDVPIYYNRWSQVLQSSPDGVVIEGCPASDDAQTVRFC